MNDTPMSTHISTTLKIATGTVLSPALAGFSEHVTVAEISVCHAQRDATPGVFAFSGTGVGPNGGCFLLDRSFAMPKSLGGSAENEVMVPLGSID